MPPQTPPGTPVVAPGPQGMPSAGVTPAPSAGIPGAPRRPGQAVAPGSLDAMLTSLLTTLQGQDLSSESARRTMAMVDQLVQTARPGEISPDVLASVPTLTAPAGTEALPVGPGETLSTQELMNQLGRRPVPFQADIAGVRPAQPTAAPMQMSPDELLQMGSTVAGAIPYALPVGPEGTLTSEQIQAVQTGRPPGSLPTALEAGLQRQAASAQTQQRYEGTPIIGVRPQAPPTPAVAAIPATEIQAEPGAAPAAPAMPVEPAAPPAPPQDLQAQQAMQDDLVAALRTLGYQARDAAAMARDFPSSNSPG